MTSIALITAMAATTGMFGSKHCGGKVHHAKKAKSCYSVAAAPAAAPCGASYGTVAHSGPMPAAYQPSPQAMPMQAVPTKALPAGAPPAPPVPAK